jgi:Putative auto-transporter adhesin, head GIN domain
VTASGIDVPRFVLDAPGACDATLSGRADRLDIHVAGLGHVRADALVAKEGHVTLEGSGDVEVDATDTLEVTVSGMGRVGYRGKPVVTKSISGLGSVGPLG